MNEKEIEQFQDEDANESSSDSSDPDQEDEDEDCDEINDMLLYLQNTIGEEEDIEEAENESS